MKIKGKDDTGETVDTLNGLLRGELAAVESYEKALPTVEDKPTLQSDLQGCRTSHEQRVERLRRAIVEAGGEPARASGAWGLFARAMTDASRALGWKVVIDTLEEGEDHGLKEYQSALTHVDDESRRFISAELFPLQQHTHGVVSALKRVASL